MRISNWKILRTDLTLLNLSEPENIDELADDIWINDDEFSDDDEGDQSNSD
ncbi:Ff.00g068060.m01.CDS01 [Fusarium sp. VM40]|nr:Ff.00g068060.m01.CDS01 [Fusarium sp. VM40]